jgi:hypothetical protein
VRDGGGFTASSETGFQRRGAEAPRHSVFAEEPQAPQVSDRLFMYYLPCPILSPFSWRKGGKPRT